MLTRADVAAVAICATVTLPLIFAAVAVAGYDEIRRRLAVLPLSPDEYDEMCVRMDAENARRFA